MEYTGDARQFALWFFGPGSRSTRQLEQALVSVPRWDWPDARKALREVLQSEYNAWHALSRFGQSAGVRLGAHSDQRSQLESKGLLLVREHYRRTGTSAEFSAYSGLAV